jgi:hypothetical protein
MVTRSLLSSGMHMSECFHQAEVRRADESTPPTLPLITGERK